MIPCIKSYKELMLLSKSRCTCKKNSNKSDFRKSLNNYDIKKKCTEKKDNKLINLPNITKLKRRKWVKSKEAVSRFFDELDYNNQIQSSYDLTLLERQNSYDKNNAA